ncbi:acetoin dehydrogenase dihydrolipoyllysine-residue acetyltransferase subunit [Acetobacter sp. DmW_136]|uniref:acetoin dehydrogenase dihydrolipoyllysine-residue acetyltransferase subunit n=1 Tax=Acetobacter sp. DmW_136 TaxID=2591091 RepID=UPI00123B0F78|nr:acetoin dehydrogenase dihydrolipoyllysine-residue acetyltransferase subunit [Acetobacter sp. DmW_136]KAA8384431.1 acetoin dehydrogenase dihydrolipoyllysine-residue acetyltransferase subunit [Acetobacter sp. DmW_136]
MTDTITALTMPKFGLAMTEGKLASWTVSVGQSVQQGDELADIETTKITSSYESPAAGVLRKQVAEAGETLPVGALIGVLADAETPDVDIEAFIKNFHADNPQDAAATQDATAGEPKQITVGEHTLNVRDVGTQQGTPIVLVHGFGGDISNWLLTQDALAADRRVIAFDLPGHGASSKNVGTGTLAFLAGVVSDLLQTLKIEKAHVVGHSLGGGIALTLLRDHPEQVASLNLLAPVGLGKDVNADFISAFVDSESSRDMKAVLQMLVYNKALVGRKMVDAVLRARRLDGARDALHVIAKACFPNGHQADDLRSVLAGAETPTQIFWGKEDEILSASNASGLPDIIPVTVFEETGHLPQLERATDMNKAIAVFVKDPEAALSMARMDATA